MVPSYHLYLTLYDTAATLLLGLLRSGCSRNSSFAPSGRSSFSFLPGAALAWSGMGVSSSGDADSDGFSSSDRDLRFFTGVGAADGVFLGVAEPAAFGVVGLRSAANTTAWHHPPSGPHCSAKKAWMSSYSAGLIVFLRSWDGKEGCRAAIA